jgi:quinol-cytochrome oxidoreductase complex cytochrome b subunit
MKFINFDILTIASKQGLCYPTPSNLNYLRGFLGMFFFFFCQVLSGIFLAIHYSSGVSLAFNSIEHIIRDVSFG